MSPRARSSVRMQGDMAVMRSPVAEARCPSTSDSAEPLGGVPVQGSGKLQEAALARRGPVASATISLNWIQSEIT